ncbi:MAG: type II secretion system protein GspM [Clostridiaceae bacterium]|nr:type II secretion system protein GspM [Clostridiaceae bacterium]
MTKLTRREKVLLYILALVIVLAGGVYFLVTPAIDAREAAIADVEAARIEYTELRGQADLRAGLESAIQEAYNKITPYAAHFGYAPMSSAGLDRLLTNLLINYGMTPADLSFDPGSIAVLTNKGYTLSSIDATARFTGTLENCVAMSEALRADAGILLLSLSASAQTQTPGGEETDGYTDEPSEAVYTGVWDMEVSFRVLFYTPANWDLGDLNG